MASSSNDTVNTVGREFVPKDAVPADFVDTMQLEDDAANGGAKWTFVSLTQESARVALDAVRYQPNYARGVISKLCLHSINTIRKRVSSGLTNYLVNVDGCESSQIEATGRCDIYYCRPYTYELQLTQKNVWSDVFIVQSIYKTANQKTLDEYRDEPSNLDWSTEIEDGFKDLPIFSPLETSVHSETGEFTGEEGLHDPKDHIAWGSTDVMENDIWELPPLVIQQATAKPLHLRAEPVTMAALETEGVTTGATIIGIATLSTIAVVIVLVMITLRARVNAAKRAENQAYPPLRSTGPYTTEDTIGAEST